MGNPTRITGIPRRSVRNFPPEWPIAIFAPAMNPASSMAAKSVSSRMTGCSSASARSVVNIPASRLLFVPLAMTTGTAPFSTQMPENAYTNSGSPYTIGRPR